MQNTALPTSAALFAARLKLARSATPGKSNKQSESRDVCGTAGFSLAISKTQSSAGSPTQSFRMPTRGFTPGYFHACRKQRGTLSRAHLSRIRAMSRQPAHQVARKSIEIGSSDLRGALWRQQTRFAFAF